ncbi:MULTISPECIES: Xaa-Pro dipeptidase [unclassified Agarivorans]|uniref:Xaa-Pro dipeptidase n=1 Tax=unclassified Agarivorans TaxID=2636026 RepID=UPI003D7EF42B
MPTIQQLFTQHIEQLQLRVADVLEREQLEALIIHSGYPLRIFLDDQHYPFQTNPHFKHWLPLTEHPHCWLVVNGVDKPTLIYHQASDYWHKATSSPSGFWVDFFDIRVMKHPQDIEPFLPKQRQRCAYIGEHPELAEALEIGERNPELVLNYLHYYRAYKTDYELECIQEANHRAVKAHLVAKELFLAGASEFEMNLAYLSSLGRGEHSLPYANIIALNENASILHYTALSASKLAEQKRYSLLIDAGAEYRGYAADITRSYAYRKGLFAELVLEMDILQQSLVNDLKPGYRYTDLHLKAHRKLAKLLVDFEFVYCSAAAAVETGITRCFFPHGLGHHLGLQVHDVGGLMQDEDGTVLAAPTLDPFLRCTRMLEPRQVLTIEPGLYFIPSLLAELAESEHTRLINWSRVDEMRRFGGIRIEDNVVITALSCDNLTRAGNWS